MYFRPAPSPCPPGPRVHIAILTHNALEFTQSCVAALARHTALSHELYVLDNGSRDDTRAWLESDAPREAVLIFSANNLGVPAGRNRLLEVILPRTQPEDLIVFLDNDVEVFDGWDQPFAELFAQFPHIGIAGVTGHRIQVGPEQRELLPSPEVGPAEVDVVSGYCLWVRAAVASALGPFDENLGLFWHEDDDYCVRAIGLGYCVYAIPDVPLFHHAHCSGTALEPEATDLSIFNQRYLMEKWRQLRLVNEKGSLSGCGNHEPVGACQRSG